MSPHQFQFIASHSTQPPQASPFFYHHHELVSTSAAFSPLRDYILLDRNLYSRVTSVICTECHHEWRFFNEDETAFHEDQNTSQTRTPNPTSTPFCYHCLRSCTNFATQICCTTSSAPLSLRTYCTPRFSRRVTHETLPYV